MQINVNEELQLMQTWFNTNKLSLNVTKGKFNSINELNDIIQQKSFANIMTVTNVYMNLYIYDARGIYHFCKK